MTQVEAAVGERHWGVSTRFRARRLALFLTIVDEIIAKKGECRILDMGGSIEYWRDLESVWGGRKLAFTIVNLDLSEASDPRYAVHQGDCRNLSNFPDMSFDVVHSNSVLEHVGRWPDMRAMAHEVRRLAPRYFVQTPSFWFPLEPHFRVPFFHWLPEPLRIALVMRRSCGAFPRAETIDDAQRFIEDAILLDARRFKTLFPDGRLERERLLGLTKSLIAIR
jgi:hypothetical protein